MGGAVLKNVDNGCIRRLGVANSVVLSFGFVLALFFVLVELFSLGGVGEAAGINRLVFPTISTLQALVGSYSSQLVIKLLNDAVDGDGGEMNRIGVTCSKHDIVIFQAQTAPLPNGIPAYTVQILNACSSGCSISNIHVSCGWFSSARLVNPRVFRRDDYDDCLVNDGEALGPGETLYFQYASSFRYRLSVSSVACC